MVCATSRGSDQPAHMRSLVRAFASCLNILLTEQHLEILSLKGGCTGWSRSIHVTAFGDSKLKRRLPRLVSVYSCQNATLLEITCPSSNFEAANMECFIVVTREILIDSQQFEVSLWQSKVWNGVPIQDFNCLSSVR